MRNWIGKSIIVIGLIHTVFAFVVFSPIVLEVFREGLFNSVNGQPTREWVFWFLFFGFLFIILGWLIDWCEHKNLEFPSFFGWVFLLFTILIIVIMPISGGWLILAPSIGLLVRKNKSKQPNQQ